MHLGSYDDEPATVNLMHEYMKESKSRSFINQIEKVNCIYNKTKEIYFDKENIYLEMK